MVDERMVGRIISAAKIRRSDIVVEIGAGRGFLTRKIANVAGKVIAIEIDRRLKKDLQRNLDGIKKIELVFGNALKVIHKTEFDKIVANIPYAICEPLIQEMVFLDFESAVLTVPKSFAERLMSKPDDKGFSKLSILAQEFFEIKPLFEVPKEAFDPIPKTRSLTVLLEPRKKKSMFSMVVKKRRMKLKNAIMRVLFEANKTTKNEARKHIKSLNINNLLEKKISEMDTEEMKTVWKRLHETQ